MAEYTALAPLFTDIANAIRSKTGETGAITANSFPQEINNISFDDKYLKLSGGTMTGDLILNGAPTADNQAATKAYVDSKGGATLIHQGSLNISSGSSIVNYQVPVSALSTILTSYYTRFILEAEHTNRSSINLTSIASTTTSFSLGTPFSRFIFPISFITTVPAGSSYQMGNVVFTCFFNSMISCTINPTTATIMNFRFECNSTLGDTLTCKFYLM